METARSPVNPERRWQVLSHVLFGVTLGVPTLTVALSGGPGVVTTLALAVAFAVWYGLLFAARPSQERRLALTLVYAAGALTLYTVLTVRYDGYFLVLYSLLPQFFSTLPRVVAALGVVGIVVLPAAARGQIAELRDPDVAFSLFATVGLGLVVTAVIEALGRLTEQQRETIDELESARGEIAGLLDTARRDLRARDALARAGHALIAARTPQAVVAALARELVDHPTGVQQVALLSRDADDRAAVVISAPETAPRPGERIEVPPIEVGVGEVVTAPAGPPTGANGGVPAARTAVVAPLRQATAAHSSDEPADVDGVPDLLWLGLTTPDLTRPMQRDMATVATQAALTLTNLRLAAQAAERGRTAGVLEERQRLAHEIHDTLAQGFTSIVTQLEAAEQSLRSEPDVAATHVDRARRTARDSLTEARRTVEALRPRPLQQSALPDALRDTATRWSAHLPRTVAVHVVVDGTPTRQAPQVDETLLRVAQEALANVARHAHARTVSITLSYLDDLVLLDVQDDGVGFDAGNGAAPADVSHGGYGLVAMRERMARIGGGLIVESGPGEGTTVAAHAPVRPPAQPPTTTSTPAREPDVEAVDP